MLDQDSNFYLIHLSLLITCLLNNVWVLLGEVTCLSLSGIRGLRGFIFPGLTFVILFYADIKVKEQSLENLMR